MNYIINPAVFYWMSVFDGLKLVTAIFFVIGCASIVSTFIIWAVNADFDYDDPDAKRWFKFFKISIAITAATSIVLIAIPSKNTMIQMLVAKYATYDNANWTMESLKSAVDYIVEAIKSLK